MCSSCALQAAGETPGWQGAQEKGGSSVRTKLAPRRPCLPTLLAPARPSHGVCPSQRGGGLAATITP
eukprot:13271-Chlamydomonas_euryale.AAC.2